MGLSADQRRAIVRVRPEGGPPDYFCTGVLIAPNFVLTAGHCDQGGAFTLELPSDTDSAGHASESLAIKGAYRHPDEDALLLELDAAPAAEPIALLEALDDFVGLLHTPVELAGFGVDSEGRPARALSLLAERVVSVDAATIAVDGEGRSGACIGDSGGPMLVRDARGALAIAGILSRGSATCTRIDRYLRADVLHSFVFERGALAPAFDDTCGAVTQIGFCRQGRAIFCDHGMLRAESCSPGESCGFSMHDRGYRCVPPEDDACGGIDDLGACDGDAASSCLGGEVTATSCAACGDSCAWDASAGRYACLRSVTASNR